MRARHHARVEDGAMVPEDPGGGRSITDDAEAVVADLDARGFDLSSPVVHRDTTGARGGIAVRGGASAGFYPFGLGAQELGGGPRRAARPP